MYAILFIYYTYMFNLSWIKNNPEIIPMRGMRGIYVIFTEMGFIANSNNGN